MSQLVDLFIGTGIQGTPGPPGPAGPVTIDIGTTETGAPGTDAQVTNSGTEENVILNFTIPQGEPGPPGGIAETIPPLDFAPETNTLFLNFALAAVQTIQKTDLLITQDAVSNLIKQTSLSNLLKQNQFKASWTSGKNITITHNLGTKDVTVQIYDLASSATIIIADVTRPTANTVYLSAPVAPTGVGYRILITAFF